MTERTAYQRAGYCSAVSGSSQRVQSQSPETQRILVRGNVISIVIRDTEFLRTLFAPKTETVTVENIMTVQSTPKAGQVLPLRLFCSPTTTMQHDAIAHRRDH